MIRLRDEVGSSDPRVARGARVVRNLQPRGPSPEAFFRVRAALRRPREQSVQHPWLVPAVTALILVGLVALASAMSGTKGGRRLLNYLVPGHAGPVKVGPSAPIPPAVMTPQIVVTPLVEQLPPPLPETPRPDPRRGMPRRAPVSAERRAAPQGEPAPADPAVTMEPAAPPEETSLYGAAFTALRKDGDPARAGRLLQEYRRSFPNGDMAEHALVLAVEASAALGEKDTEALVAEYLRQYPSGRYKEQVLHLRKKHAPR